MAKFWFESTPIDSDALKQALTSDHCGGFTSFEGWVRNHNEGEKVSRLEYEAYQDLAVKEGQRIVEEALATYAIENAQCVHRVGELAIGDMAVWVGVSSAHRDAAFKACRFIIDQVKARVPIWKKEHYVQGDSGWVNCERPQQHQKARSADYSRQVQLKEVGPAGQQVLQNSRVLVLGAGGLGCPAIAYLAGAGIGQLGIVDDDSLDASNLHRQTVYKTEDIGQPKAQLAADYVSALNREVAVNFHTKRLSVDEMLSWFEQYDVVLDCTDNLSSKQLISDVAVVTSTPFISASVYQFEGQLQTFSAKPSAPCFRCVWPNSENQSGVLSCAEAGVLGPVPGVLGSLQALEAIKLLLDSPEQLGGDLLLLNMLNYETQRIKLPANYEDEEHLCLADIDLDAYRHKESLEVAFSDVQAVMNSGMIVVDIRESKEMDAQPLPGAIPLSKQAVDWSNIDDRRYLLVCARGIRSKVMAAELADKKIKAFSLSGGMQGLSERQD